MATLNRKIIKELLGIILIALTLFFAISLSSYNSNDPSFKRYTSNSNNIKINNYGGIVGAYLSEGLVQFFGSGAYVITFILLYIGVNIFFKRILIDYIRYIVGGVFFSIFFCSFLFLYFNKLDPFYSHVKGGGLTGYSITGLLTDYFNKTGSVIIIITGLLSSFIIFTRFSFISAFTGTCAIVTNLLSKIRLKITILKVKIKKRREIKQIRESGEKKQKKGILKIAVSKRNSNNKKNKDKTNDVVQRQFNFMADGKGYLLPSLSLLNSPPKSNFKKQEDALIVNSNILEKKLKDFGINGKVLQVIPGPVITRYEFEPASGIKVSKIISLSDDLAMGMRAISIRILAPVPGKAVVGIEIPNINRETIFLKDLLTSEKINNRDDSLLPLALGKNISGETVITDLVKIPHLLIAGATGAGKSVGVNSMICSLLFNKTPEEVKFLMIDPKMIELSIYDGIPHLLTSVVVDPKKAASALKWAVEEMERRYKLMASKGVRNISSYNKVIDIEKKKETKPKDEDLLKEESADVILPYIVVVIDELADLMMVSSRDVETSLTRLAQMARAAGIHLLLATQRPSVDVLTGIIKANFPARISFQVTSRIDSRTILDSIGAERLLGNGDMLFLPPGSSMVERIHGPLVGEPEIKKIVEFIKNQQKPKYNEGILDTKTGDEAKKGKEEYDEKYDEALALVAETRQASISMIQRRLRVGYNRAARMIEVMEKEGVIGQSDGVKPRKVFVQGI